MYPSSQSTMNVFLCMIVSGFIARARPDIILPRNAPAYITTYQAAKTSAWGVPTLVPCPPITWTNPHSTPIIQTTTVTKTLPGTTACSTSEITKTIPANTTITETDTYYTESTITHFTTLTQWTTETSYEGEWLLVLFGT